MDSSHSFSVPGSPVRHASRGEREEGNQRRGNALGGAEMQHTSPPAGTELVNRKQETENCEWILPIRSRFPVPGSPVRHAPPRGRLASLRGGGLAPWSDFG